MKKHISVLMLDLSENFIVTLIACGVIIAIDLISFAISGYRAAGSEENILGKILDSQMGRNIYWVVLWILIIFSHLRLRKHAEEKEDTENISKPEYTAQRLLTSERMVYVWKAAGNMIRIIIIIALQIVMIYLMRMVSQRIFPENYDALSSYIDLAAGSWSGIFIPTAGSIMSVIALIIAGGLIITWFEYATGGRAFAYIILTVLIGLGVMDIRSDDSPMSAILYIGVGLVLFIYVLIVSHTGRKPGKPGIHGGRTMKGFDYNRLRDNVLPGKDPKEVFQSSVVWGICWAIIPHMISFYTKYVDAWKTVRYFRTGQGHTENFLSEDVVHMLQFYKEFSYMPSFGTLIAGAYSGVIIYVIYRLIRASMDRSYFIRDSKSIYVMKRLDEKSPIGKRCWSRAIAGIGACIAAAAVMTLIDFLVYRIITPGDYLIPGGAL